jgi:hypothetical protein
MTRARRAVASNAGMYARRGGPGGSRSAQLGSLCFTIALVFSGWERVICVVCVWLYACLGVFWLGVGDMRRVRMALRLPR